MTDAPKTKEKATDDPLMRERRPGPVVPAGSVSGSTLALVIAIMTFLASLTLGGVLLVNNAATGWAGEVSQEVTVQLPPGAANDDAAIDRVLAIARGHSGIAQARVIDDVEMAVLLQPWLGSGLDLAELPVPRLVTLTVQRAAPPDLVSLQSLITEAVPGAVLDDHRAWRDRLAGMAAAMVAGGIGVFILMLAATVLTVIFATRGALAGNAQVIEVLQVVGAEDRFIASAFQRRFLALGLQGALAGGAIAALFFVTLEFLAGGPGDTPVAEQAQALFGSYAVGTTGYVSIAVLVFAIALLTAFTSRATVLRHAGTVDPARG